jgi:hypothetical protein
MTQKPLLNVPGLERVPVEAGVRDSLVGAEARRAAGKPIHLERLAGQSLPRLRRSVEIGAA